MSKKVEVKKESGQRQSKYNVDQKDKEKRTYDGIVFDSVMEMKYYRDVVLPEHRSGAIKNFELQKKYELQPKFKHNGKTVLPIQYVADFYIEYADGREEIIDTKGFADSVAKIKRKMMWYQFPNVEYRWIVYSKMDGGWCDYDVVAKRRNEQRKARKKAKTSNGE